MAKKTKVVKVGKAKKASAANPSLDAKDSDPQGALSGTKAYKSRVARNEIAGLNDGDGAKPNPKGGGFAALYGPKKK